MTDHKVIDIKTGKPTAHNFTSIYPCEVCGNIRRFGTSHGSVCSTAGCMPKGNAVPERYAGRWYGG